MHPRVEPAGLFALALLSIIWAWWAAKEGAYFPVVLLPGTIVLCLGTALLAGVAPWRGKLSHSRATGVALFALAALGCWSLLSALWSPAPDVAIADGQRILVYALAFGLGIWLCTLLGPRMELVAGAGGCGGGVRRDARRSSRLVAGDTPKELFEIDGTLDFPLGYRNANAAFFAIAFFPALGLAMHQQLDWRLRGAALATATVCIDLMLFSQSRGSLPALLLALLVFVVLSPYRVRALSWLALAALPAARASRRRSPASTRPPTTRACATRSTRCMPPACCWRRSRSPRSSPARRRHGSSGVCRGLGSATPRRNRSVALAIATLAAVGAVGFVAAVGDPVDWIGQRADEFRSAGTPDDAASSSRFSFNAGSNRYDLWRVALDDFAEDPLLGDGGGGYQYTYTAKREVAYQSAHDAHSVELELLAELGLPGLALFVCAIVGADARCARARAASAPRRPAVSAVALASGTYWLAHSSIDWFWPYPAVTAPTMALLGAACGPAVRHDRSPRAGLVATVADRRRRSCSPLSAVPLVALASATSTAPRRAGRRTSARAFDDLARAQDLNPLSDWPILVEGEIAKQSGDNARAIDAFTRAVEKRPEEYAGHYRLAELLAERDPALARSEILIALELNPLDRVVRRLATRLGPRSSRRDGTASQRRLQSRGDQLALDRQRDGLGSRPRPELRLRVAHVRLHGRGRELEHGRDLAVRRAAGEQGEDLALARGRRSRRRQLGEPGADLGDGVRAGPVAARPRGLAPVGVGGRVEPDQVTIRQHAGGHREPDFDRRRGSLEGEGPGMPAVGAERLPDVAEALARILFEQLLDGPPDDLAAGQAEQPAGTEARLDADRLLVDDEQGLRAGRHPIRRRHTGSSHVSHSAPRRAGTARPAPSGRDERRGRARPRSRPGSARRRAPSAA